MEQVILKPDAVKRSMEKLFLACYRDTQEYADNIAQISAHMSKRVNRFDRVLLLLAVKKLPSNDISPCTNICENGNCSEARCLEKTKQALMGLVEPMIPQLDGNTKKHLAILAKEVPHLSDIFMEFHDKIA